MVHAKLSVLSLLCFLCALLMLPPELTLGKVIPSDAGEQKAMEFAIQQYNQENQKSSIYFKKVSRVEARTEVVNGVEYHLTVRMVRTICKKSTGKTMTFKQIQRCQQPLGNRHKKTCYFKVSSHPPLNEMKLAVTDCEEEQIQKNASCLGKGI